MYTLNTHPRGQISLFHSTTRHFRDTRLSKIRNAPDDLDDRMTSSTELPKVPCIHWIHTPKTQISLYNQLFQDTSLKIRNTPNDLKHLTAETTLYTLNTHPEAQISLHCSMTSHFRDIRSKTGNAPNDLKLLTVKCYGTVFAKHPCGRAYITEHAHLCGQGFMSCREVCTHITVVSYHQERAYWHTLVFTSLLPFAHRRPSNTVKCAGLCVPMPAFDI